MIEEEKTYRFTCDGMRGKRNTPCPNTMRLTGTEPEVLKYFRQSGWQTSGPSGIEKHICPRKHDAVDESESLGEKRIGLFGGIPVYETQNAPAGGIVL